MNCLGKECIEFRGMNRESGGPRSQVLRAVRKQNASRIGTRCPEAREYTKWVKCWAPG